VTAPAEAPRPPAPMSWNPFVLEVGYAHSLDDLVAIDRGKGAVTEVNLLLAAFVPWIAPPEPWGRIEQQWAIPIGKGQSSMRPIWTQKSYVIDGFKLVTDTFTAQTEPELELVDEDVIYARRGLSGGEELDLPKGIRRIFDSYYRLDATRRERFLRWCYWINHSQSVASLSTSASYMALIQAVEALRPDVRGGPACSECGRHIGPGPTRQFIAFMDEFVPRQDGETEGERRLLYNLRSRLAHGGTLMERDLRTGFGQFTPTWIEERETSGRAAVLARMAGINWLLADGP
jgi:hypothetical protein